MTVQSTDRKAGPFFSGTILPFDFKVFSKEDIQVIWTSAAGVESILVLDSEYSVALNPDQDNTPGGSVTLNTAISGGANTVIIGDLIYDQGTDIRNQNGFEPEILEDALDRVTILVQQLLEMAKRTLRIPASSSSTISTQLPQPTAGNVLGWNGEGDQLTNLSPQDIATTVAFGTAFVDQFEGDGVETEFALSANPALLANMDVQVDGTSLRNGIDFVLLAGAVIKFTTAPAAPGVPGEPNIQVRGTVAVPQGFDTADVVVTQLPDSGLWTTVQGFINRVISGIGASIVGYTPAGTGAVSQTLEDFLRNRVTARGFGCNGDGSDEGAKLQAAINYARSTGKWLDGESLTISTAQEILTGGNLKLKSIEIRAIAAMDSVLHHNVTAELNFDNITLTPNGLAIAGFKNTGGINQGSHFCDIRTSGTTYGWQMLNYIYNLNVDQMIINGGQYGVFSQANTPLNGATFTNLRVSNTSIRAFFAETTGANTNVVTLISPTFEGNNGGAIHSIKTSMNVIAPYFESNGAVTGDPDILIGSTSSIVTNVRLFDAQWGPTSAAQSKTFTTKIFGESVSGPVRVKLDATHTRYFSIYAKGNQGIVDGANFTSATAIAFIGDQATVVNFLSSGTQQGQYNERSFTTTGTQTGLQVGDNLSKLLMCKTRTGNNTAAGLYLLNLESLTIGGGVYHDAVNCATTANITLSGEQTIDGFLTSASRVLVKNQTTASENGVYVSSAGAWVRATDFDTDAEQQSAVVKVLNGTVNAGTYYQCTASNISTAGTNTFVLQQNPMFQATLIGGTNVATFSDDDYGRLIITAASGTSNVFTDFRPNANLI